MRRGPERETRPLTCVVRTTGKKARRSGPSFTSKHWSSTPPVLAALADGREGEATSAVALLAFDLWAGALTEAESEVVWIDS